MRSRFLMLVALASFFATLATPVGLAAQNKQAHKSQSYKLLDLGTFGGPVSWFCNDLNLAGGACAILNRRGAVVSGADTSQANPNYQNPSPFFPPFSVPGDPFTQHAFQWQGGALQDLGALPRGYNSWAQAVSANGLIAGLSENGEIDPMFGVPEAHAVLWTKNGRHIIDLGTLEGGYESLANGVNSSGQVVGIAFNTIADPFWFFPIQSRAFLWHKGTMQDLGTLGTGTDAQAYWINERGQIAGTSFTNTTVNPVLTYCTGFQIETPTQDPFLWHDGNLIDLGSLGGTCGVPNAINNRGQVVGLSDTAGDAFYHAFLWPGRGNQMQDIGTLGGCCAIANWIDDAGAVVGGSWTASDKEFHAFLWKHGAMMDLGPRGSCTEALGVNSEDQVVGFSCGNTAALLWDNGQTIDLNVFNYPGSGLQSLNLAYNINDRGEIVGLGAPPGCDDVFSCGHTFVLTPCDERHSGVEGCDHSMADETDPVTEPSTPPTRVSGTRLDVLRDDSRFRRHSFEENGRGGGARMGRSSAVADIDVADSPHALIRGGNQGYCLVSNNKLTGTCIGPGSGGFSCFSKVDPVHCPSGKRPMRPGTYSCAVGQVVTVDVARHCIDH